MLVTLRRSLILPLLLAAGPLLAQDSLPAASPRPIQVTDSAVARGRRGETLIQSCSHR